MRRLRAGDWVEVRSKEEILATLDKQGRLQGLPFMPQMFQYCGKRFKVFKRAHKTCDTVNPIAGRLVIEGVHLEHRCDGSAYGGCQACCLIFWKEAWLKCIDDETIEASVKIDIQKSSCTEEDVWNATRVDHRRENVEPIYACQATQLPYFTTPLRWWDVRQYFEDYNSGNVEFLRIVHGAIYLVYYHFTLAKRGRLGRPARWLYECVTGNPFPGETGIIALGEPTPIVKLNLQPGELVRVKRHDEILKTLDQKAKNRNMVFDAELVPYCGRIYRVKTRVDRFINENTGKMSSLKTPAVILEGVWCQSRYSNCRMFCPRSIYSWWREIWLERVEADT